MDFYSRNLLPVLRGLEEQRKKSIKSAVIAFAVILLIGIGIMAAVYQVMASGDLDDLLMFNFIIVVLMIAGMTWAFVHFTGEYKRRFKNEVVGAIIGFIAPELKYDMNGTIPRREFKKSRIFDNHIDRYEGEDYVWGTVGRTKIGFCEVHAEEERKRGIQVNNRGARSNYNTVFKGLFFVADFNKDFKGLTVVLPDFAEKTFGSLIGNIMQNMNPARQGELVKLEDPEFQKSFVVYSDDQVEARYILTPALMKRILDFRNNNRLPVYMSFHNSKLYMAIVTGRNMFEPPYFRSAEDFRLIKEYYEDFTFAVGIVDELNLNTRIWTRE